MCLRDVKRKEQLQKLLFPEGIVYDLKNNTFRTDRVNVIFMLMAHLANNTGAKEKGQTNALACLSLSAEKQGFEPWIPFDRYTHFPGVPLQPLEHLSVSSVRAAKVMIPGVGKKFFSLI